MVDHWLEFTRFGIGLFALLSPFTALPYVLSVSSRFGSRAVLTMAGAATATMILVLSTMHLVGEAVLITLGTSLPSFQIGGGLIILLSGLAMLGDPPASGASAANAGQTDMAQFIKLGVAPLGIPMLAGAGAITKVVIETHPEYGLSSDVHITGIIVVVCLMAGAIVASSSVLVRLLGAAFFSVMSRLAGLVIVAVAVEIMAKGILTHARNMAGS